MVPHFLVFAALLLAVTKGVEITRLSMPRWVQNGTEDSVVLDCEYNYSEEEDKRLVVKWFLNDDPQPIYQWIPELKQRFASPRLQGKLNMAYTVSPSSQHTMYRALNIVRPTTDLSGRYSCHVVSLFSQDMEEQVMVVYAPPSRFEFNFTRQSSDSLNLTCEADGVFPKPTMTLLQIGLEYEDDEWRDSSDQPARLVSGVKTSTRSHRSTGAYHIQASREIRDSDLGTNGELVVIACVLSIPGTDYEKERRLLFYSGLISSTWRPREEYLFLLVVVLLITTSLLS
ncbi:uncharacterized protein LOC129222214 [Uloborus diversus]|uniref:uncharacterized protein LOC129222214 n=1 Tax=Uloborus diversus TaxID=327109 RepID=UPI00240A7B86|nr:uncharacterized protein LOC129222214 [Uloborus diversus]